MQYRSRTDIVRSILNTIKDQPATKTRIMYGAYLSYAQVKEYLEFLTQKGMIEYSESTSQYYLTGHGRTLLGDLDRIAKVLTV